VVEKWNKAAQNNEPLTITDLAMTRFFFSPSSAVDLIFSAMRCEPRCIYAASMKAMSIKDLADIMQTNGVRVLGPRQGEKTHECLVTADEMRRTSTCITNEGKYMHQIGEKDLGRTPNPYTSETAPRMSREEILELLYDKFGNTWPKQERN
jgi:FlaA1/EpsC-like NDP-sugar epimerase